MSTRPDKSIMFFMEQLFFCLKEMRGLHDARELVLVVTPEARDKIRDEVVGKNHEWFVPKYINGVEMKVVDEVDSELGFKVCKRGCEDG